MIPLGGGKGMAVWDTWGLGLHKIPQGPKLMEAAESPARKGVHPLGK